MSLKLKNKSNTSRYIKTGLISGAVIISTSYLALKTFPHLKTSIYNYITGEDSQTEEELEEIEKQQVVIESKRNDPHNKNKIIDKFQSQQAFDDNGLNDSNTWSIKEIKDWLIKVCSSWDIK
ncbi:hypothetical protein KGF54_002608 [Candida jiufengensis]|uniref:uncharacterized protein n=1 Tax=Candida jiufengensis TaxID=497108 RepID=UPI00222487DB|nr:uncharacterized protein KGF54_002608 [Candida jiufengensis]KAI5953237.1 hypothetical protein KGF54_002608 [Candida jiufengensis]